MAQSSVCSGKIFSDAVLANEANPGAVTQHLDTALFAGSYGLSGGVFQMKGRAICQAFVPSTLLPGGGGTINIGFVKSTFNGTVFIGYYDGINYHVEKSTSNKQDQAFIRTLWHRIKTDKIKRWQGIKLNLKPLAANTSVAIWYRTDRQASFTNSGYTIDSTNQDKPVLFAVQPRSREIQFKLVYTTATTHTPELLTYDVLHEELNTIR